MIQEIQKHLEAFNQEHLIGDLSHFNEEQLKTCLSQLQGWRREDALLQKTSWENREKTEPFEPFLSPEKSVFEERPIKKSAALFLAGGQGSRLGFDGPKGCYPILGKTLFERHAEKISPTSSVAILTSPSNHQETLSFFEKKDYFGLQKPLFFSQEMLPFLDESGKWFWSSWGKIAAGPDGNGSVFLAFKRAGLFQQFEQVGVERFHIVPVDNPLADPFDRQLANFHEEMDAEISFRCIYLSNPQEPMGRLIRRGKKLAIQEFSELTEESRIQNRYANTGLFVINLSLMERLSNEIFPLHWAWKSTDVFGKKKFAWKAERFIVDALKFTEKSYALSSERDSCYAPLKEIKSIREIEKLLML